MSTEEQNQTRNNWLAALLVTTFIFLIIGYAWCYKQGTYNYERGFEDGMKEMSVVTRREICQ